MLWNGMGPCPRAFCARSHLVYTTRTCEVEMAIVNKMLFVLFLAVMPEYFVVTAQTIQEGIQALKSKDYQTALLILRPLAEKGDAQAQSALGFMYVGGLGVPKNDVEAMNWYRK